MSRYVFYFAIALLAFVTGVFSVYLILLSAPAGTVEEVEPTKGFDVFSVLNERSFHEETGIESLISDKEKALLLFEPTLKRWLNGKRIARPVEPSAEIIERIAITRLHKYEAPYIKDRARRSYKPSLPDLNGDGKPELAILINIKGSDDSDLWIFREVKGDFEVILHSRGQFDKFELKKTKSNGFFDLQTSYYPNDPRIETLKSMTDYKFDGEEYSLRGCSGIVDRYRDENGDLRYFKKPTLQHYDDCC